MSAPTGETAPTILKPIAAPIEKVAAKVVDKVGQAASHVAESLEHAAGAVTSELASALHLGGEGAAGAREAEAHSTAHGAGAGEKAGERAAGDSDSGDAPAPASLRDEFLAANASYASWFAQDKDGQQPLPPARHALVLACMDARLHVEKVLGIANGACHCVRNAGGRASDDALRSIAISQRLLGTREVHIVHHTDCGMLTFTNEQLATKIKAELGVDVSGRDFLPFPDLAQSVRDDVRTVRESPLVARDTVVHGYIYHVHTGRVEPVE